MEPGRRLAIAEYDTTLRDGTPVIVRRVVPGDKDLIREGFARLSPETRLRRFLAPIAELSEEELRHLTEVDQVNHVAWIAVLRDQPGSAIGIGRFVRVPDEPEVAEAAITVGDEFQGRGLGTLLLALLAAAARVAGITSFRAWVLEENAPMRELLEDVGARVWHEWPGTLRVEVPLDPEDLPDSPASGVLRAVAASLGIDSAREPS